MLRYSVQRYGSWVWLDTEAPLITDGPEWALSSYGIMDATVAPAQGTAKAEDGRLIYERWGTLIHAETEEGADRRRWTGIVVDSRRVGKEWKLKIHEFPGYLHDLPFEGMIRGVRADPVDLLRQIWSQVQSWPTSWLGVTVAGSSPARLGTDSDDRVAAARAVMDARKQTLDSLSKTKTAKTGELQDLTATLADEVAEARALVTQAQQQLTNLLRAGAPAAQITAARQLIASRQAALATLQAAYQAETAAGKTALKNAKRDQDAARTAYDQAREAYDRARDRAREDGGAYEIRGDEFVDAHRAAVELCRAGGIEWRTSTQYVTEGPPQLTIHAAQKLGTRRDDLVFEQGVNVVSDLDLETPESYANAGIGVGAGEGAAAVRVTVGTSSVRLRRPLVVEDKTAKTRGRLEATTRAEMRLHADEPYVREVEVVDHPLAPLWSWQVGDLITVRGVTPHGGEVSILHRIISWQLKGPTRAVLRLALP